LSPPAQSDAPGCPGAEEFLKTILVDDSRISFIPPCSNNKETVRHSEVVANSQELWTLETFVFSEVLKQASWSGESCALYHYRDKDQDEVDLVIETGSGALVGIEVKASATVNAGDFKGLRKLAEACGDNFKLGVVLYDGGRPVPFGDRLIAAPMSCLWA
jgi:predicted AAA+ superfamily ATPase